MCNCVLFILSFCCIKSISLILQAPFDTSKGVVGVVDQPQVVHSAFKNAKVLMGDNILSTMMIKNIADGVLRLYEPRFFIYETAVNPFHKFINAFVHERAIEFSRQRPFASWDSVLQGFMSQKQKTLRSIVLMVAKRKIIFTGLPCNSTPFSK